MRSLMLGWLLCATAAFVLGVTGFLVYSAVSDWWDDPFWAWLGAGILGISGLSILLSGLRK